MITNPLINITLPGRYDSYPKHRGLIHAPEPMAAGVLITSSHDGVMGPWDEMSSCDMFEVAHIGLHVAQMTGHQGIGDCFNAVTTNGATVTHLQGNGLDVGCDASFVQQQARDAVKPSACGPNSGRSEK